MGSHPINLALRFILELAALYSIGAWAWKSHDGWMKYTFAFAIPLLLMIVWGVFAVPDDPSRSGNAPIPTPGLIRLMIELFIFAFASWSLYKCQYDKAALTVGLLVLIHYVISYDRVLWLISK